MYAAIDRHNISGTVYGIGHTKSEALLDARKSAGPRGSYQLVPITDSAVKYVKKYGGKPSPDLIVSQAGVELAED